MPSSTIDLKDLDNKLRSVLKTVGDTGMAVHEIRLETAFSQLKKNVIQLSSLVKDATGIENVSSLAQVKKYLDDEGYPTKSVAADVLAQFVGIVPFVEEISKLRKYINLQSKLRSFEKAIDMDGRVRFHFNIDHDTTGRLYVTDYNLQQLPAVGRHCILPDGYMFAVLDFKQFDLRVMAADSGDPDLVQAFMMGHDPYVETAKRLFQTEEVSNEQRQVAKMVNLAICYGADTRTLSFNLGVTADTAKEILDNYLKAYPTLNAWISNVKVKAAASGYAENRFGRRMQLDWSDKPKALRQAIAMRGQGGAADILRHRLVDLDAQHHGKKTPFSMTVHDSIVIDVEQEQDYAAAVTIMGQPLEILEGPRAGEMLPLELTVKTGESWGLAAHREELEQDFYEIKWQL